MWFIVYNMFIWFMIIVIKVVRIFFFIGLGVCIGEIIVEFIKIGDLI